MAWSLYNHVSDLLSTSGILNANETTTVLRTRLNRIHLSFFQVQDRSVLHDIQSDRAGDFIQEKIMQRQVFDKTKVKSTLAHVLPIHKHYFSLEVSDAHCKVSLFRFSRSCPLSSNLRARNGTCTGIFERTSGWRR